MRRASLTSSSVSTYTFIDSASRISGIAKTKMPSTTMTGAGSTLREAPTMRLCVAKS
jgi:hypothetical protein